MSSWENPSRALYRKARQLILPLIGMLAGSAMIVPLPVSAADVGQARFGDDYASFQMSGDDWHPCERQCAQDVSCKSWTFITALGQCRLKHSVPQARSNPCCVTGVKADTVAAVPQGDEAVCARYANEALDANAQNQRTSCGLTGPVWSTSYEDLFARCLDSSPARRNREADDRHHALQACLQSAEISKKLVCDHYARLAVAESQTNSQNNCGLGGPQWSGDLEQHRRFCTDNERASVNDLFNTREQQLVECLARGGAADDADCQAYAAKSIDQFGEAQKHRCGDNYSGAGWSGDRSDNYRWCRQHNRDERVAALANRDEALRGCTTVEIDLGKVFKFKF